MANPPLQGYFHERIAATASLSQPQWWIQLDSVAGYPAGPYLYENNIWGYFGEAGADRFDQALIEGADYPPLRVRRLTNVVSGGRNSISTVARTSGDMLDGFGGGLRFGIQDGAMSAPEDIAEVGASRNGADDRGLLYLVVMGGGLGDGGLALDYNGVGRWSFRSGLTTLGDADNAVLFSMARKFLAAFASTPVANTVAETSLLTGGGHGSKTFPANFWYEAGRPLAGKLRGVFSTTGTPTLRLRAKLGGVTVLDTGAVTLAGTISNHYWEFDFELVCAAVGVTGNFAGAGKFVYDNTAHNAAPFGAANSAGAVIDTTGALALDVTATWGAASASNTLTALTAAIDIAK